MDDQIGELDNLPRSYSQAIASEHGKQWELAIKDELAKMDKYNVWEVVPR